MTACPIEYQKTSTMRIQELKLIRYGKFTDRSLLLAARSRDIHLIVGPNETGKSTVRSAISDWLFGIPMRTPLGFLHPMPELRLGGVIERLASGGLPSQSFEFDRCKGNKNTLRTPQDVALPDATLQPWLGSIQAPAFNRMYALDHDTLVEGGDGILSASDDIGRMLFQSAAGIEHLGDVLQKLQAETDALWAPRKASSRIYYQALEAYDTAAGDFKSAALRTKDWKTQHEALLETDQRLATARQRDTEIRQQMSQLERIRRVRPLLLALDAAQLQHDQLLAMGNSPLLAQNAAQVLSEANRSLALAGADRERLVPEIAQVQAALDAVQVDQTALALAEDITELNERRLQFRAHRTDIVKRAEEIRLQWVRVQELAGGLGWSAESEDSVRQRLPGAPVRSRLSRSLKDRAKAAQELHTAQVNLSERQDLINHAQESLKALTDSVLAPGLAPAVEQALKLGDHAILSSDLSFRLTGLEQDLALALAALGAWRLPAADLVSMHVPAAAYLQGLVDQHRSDATEAQTLQEEVDSKKQDLQRLALELQHLVRDFRPVSREQVDEARRTRNSAWQAIKHAPHELVTRAADFESQVAEADTLADARLDRAQHEADRQAKSDRIAQQGLALQAYQDRLAFIKAKMASRLAEWRTLVLACGIELPLEVAQSWFEQRQRVLDLLREKTDVQRLLQSRLDSASKLQTAIWSMLHPEAPDDSAPELADCIALARATLFAAERSQGNRQELERQIREGQGSLQTLQHTLRASEDAWASWERHWHNAVGAAGYAANVMADQVEAEMEVMQEIERLLDRIRNIRSERIDTMQADLDGLSQSATALAGRVAPTLIGDTPENIAMALSNHLEQAKRAQTASAELQNRLAKLGKDLAEAEQRKVTAQASLAPLMLAAAVDDIDALGRAIERSDQRREAERKMDASATALSQASDGMSAQALREEMAGIGPDESKAELERLSALSTEVVGEIADLSNRHGILKTAMEAFDGTGRAAQAEARRQEAIAAMAQAAEQYLKLHTAARLLKWSMEKFRETKQGPMLARASSVFSTLTLGSFNRLLVDSEGQSPRLFGIRPEGTQVDVQGMSEGTRDQLYLALRLAALELQIEQGLNMPLVADDLFINFDDHRTTAGLKVLGELSQKMQVIMLTHHSHLVALARDALGTDLNVIYL